MSTVSRINFELVSDIMQIQRRDFPVADVTLLNPTNAISLVDGEWLTLDATGKLVRATAIGTPGDAAALRSFPLFMEVGRSDVLAMADRKTMILYLGDYEFDTRIFDAGAAIGGGAAITMSMQPLKVATITIGARNFSGLVGHGGGADTAPVVGYVSKLPAVNGGKLRFIKGGR